MGVNEQTIFPEIDPVAGVAQDEHHPVTTARNDRCRALLSPMVAFRHRAGEAGSN
jgi:hypothetical protein